MPDHEHHHKEHEHASASPVRRWVDYVGAGVGLLCAVHCALTPIALVLSPLAGVGYLWSEEGEELMLLSLIALALVSAVAAGLKSRNIKVSVGFVISLTLLLVSHELAEGDHDAISAPMLLSILGGVGVMGCHLWSLKLQRAQRCCSTGA